MSLTHALVTITFWHRGIAAAARPARLRAAGPFAPSQRCAVAALPPKRYEGPETAFFSNGAVLFLIPLALQAVENNGRVAKGTMDRRWPWMMLHHERRVDQLDAHITC